MATTTGPGAAPSGPRSLGQHLACRLTQIGCEQFFGVPGRVCRGRQSREPQAPRSPLVNRSPPTGRLPTAVASDCSDYNLQLLDELEKEPGLRGVWCCNELNAGCCWLGGGAEVGEEVWEAAGVAGRGR